MDVLTPKNLKIIEFVTCKANSDGEPIKGTEVHRVLLFNQTQISEEQVKELIDADRWEWDNRVTELRKGQLEYLHDKESE